MLRTAHTTEADLARALAQELEARGVRFPAVFPYNRFDHERSTWWLSRQGSPAFSAAKLCVTRDADDQIEVGAVLEKGYEPPVAEMAPATQRLSSSWDWHSSTQQLRSATFAAALATLAPRGLRIRVDAHPMGTRNKSDRLVFWPAPWTRKAYVSDSPASRPLLSVSNAGSLTELLDALAKNPQRAFCWYDLYLTAPLERARSKDDPVSLDERVVDELLLPLTQALPDIAPSEP